MIKYLILIISILFSSHCFAANHYILEGGTGDGSAYNSALDDLPADELLVRGDTYYIGDGTYAGHTFDKAVSGTSVITIKKATIADHGTETGWDNAYGDGQAIINGIYVFSTAYYTLDGNSTSQYGFVFYPASGTYGVIKLNSHCTVKSVKVDFFGYATTTPRGFYASAMSNILIQHVEVTGSINDGIVFSGVTDSTIDGAYLHDYFYQSSPHADGIEIQGGSNITIKNCTLDWRNTNYGTSGDTLQFGAVYASYGPIYVYNNVFRYGHPIHDNSGNSTFTLYFYGNTIINSPVAVLLYSNCTADIQNNIFYNSSNFTWRNATHDYNYYSGDSAQSEAHGQYGLTIDKFTSPVTDVYSLISATPAGNSAIGATYNTDINGVTRGADGVWDIGAYEYEGTVESPRRVTVGMLGQGAGSVVADSGDITGGALTGLYADTTEITLTATPTSPDIFKGWSGAGCSGTGTCTFTVNGDDVSVLAEFQHSYVKSKAIYDNDGFKIKVQ
jgi:hypothetical protein